MWISDSWQDFEVLDCSRGEKLERWGKYTLVRPDPQAIWDTPRTDPRWRTADGRYSRSHTGGGDEHAEAVGAGIFGEVRCGGRGTVRAEDVRLVGDAEGVELLAGRFDDRPIGIAAHNDCCFFHEILLKR